MFSRNMINQFQIHLLFNTGQGSPCVVIIRSRSQTAELRKQERTQSLVERHARDLVQESSFK